MILFAVLLSLFLAHEMDAVRKHEWVMLNLKDDEHSYRLFLIVHIPLYAVILTFILTGYDFIGFVITDVFLISHLIVHVLFRNHSKNIMIDKLSLFLIYSAGLLAIIHLFWILMI